MTHIRLAAAHIAPVFMDPQKTAEKACDWIARAKEEKVQLLVFPEVFLPGFPYWINCYPPLIQGALNREYQDLSVTADGPEIAAVRNAARDANITVVMGASERGANSRTCYNSAFIINADGELAFVHRKLKPTYAERYIWGEGSGADLGVAQTAAGRIGALNCWEHMMNLARQALGDQNMEIHAALWPALSTMAGFEDVANLQIQAMMQSHAVTTQCFVVSASSPVTQEMLTFLETRLGPQEFLTPGGGWSAIIHPFGPIMAGPIEGTQEQLVIADAALDERSDAKMWVDTSGHYSRPDVLKLSHIGAHKPF